MTNTIPRAVLRVIAHPLASVLAVLEQSARLLSTPTPTSLAGRVTALAPGADGDRRARVPAFQRHIIVQRPAYPGHRPRDHGSPHDGAHECRDLSLRRIEGASNRAEVYPDLGPGADYPDGQCAGVFLPLGIHPLHRCE